MEHFKRFTLSAIALTVMSISSVAYAQAQSATDQQATSNSTSNQDSEGAQLTPEMEAMLEERRIKLELKKRLDEMEKTSDKERQLDGAIDLTPEEILKLRLKLLQEEKAKNIPVTGPIKSLIENQPLDVDNQKPIHIKTAPGYVSSLVFFDSTGAPWPIEYARPGNDTDFTIESAGSEANVATISAGRNFVQGNAIIGLVGLPTTVILDLQSNNDEVHSRMSFRIPQPGPNAKQMSVVTRDVVENAPKEMFDLLNGRKLPGSKNMRIRGVNSAEAYLYKGYIYISTPHTLLWPAALNSVSLPTGKKAYRIQNHQNLIFSVNGDRVHAKVVPFNE